MATSKKRYFFARNAGMHSILKKVFLFLTLAWGISFIAAYVPISDTETGNKILIDNSGMMFNFISAIFTGYIVSFIYYKLNTYPEIIRNDKLKEVSLYNIANTFKEMLLLRNVVHNIKLENDNYSQEDREILSFTVNTIKNSIYFILYTQSLFSSEILDISKKMQVYIEKISTDLNSSKVIADDIFLEVDKLSSDLFSESFFGSYLDKDEIKSLYDTYKSQCTLQAYLSLAGSGMSSFVGTNFTATVQNITETVQNSTEQDSGKLS